MNQFLQYLMSILRANNQMRQSRQSAHSSNAPGDPTTNAGQTPDATRLLMQLYQSYLNPGGGRMGNDTVGGGQVFGGFTRGSNSDPNKNPAIGNTAWLSGNSPHAYGQSQMTQTLQPGWGAQNWMAQFQNDLNSQAQGGGTPYGQASNSGGLFGGLFSNDSGAQFHGGSQGMLDFLNRGTSLQSMDDAFSGGGAQGGMSGGLGDTNLYF